MPKGRQGARMGNAELVDPMIHDGPVVRFDHVHMGEATDAVNAGLGISSLEQDEWSARLHERAAEATKAGRLGSEIIPVDTPGRKGDGKRIETEEGTPPGMTAESIAKMRPAFTREGTITVANASQISDGAASFVVTSRERADSLPAQPANATAGAASKLGVDPASFDLYEVNEAFAAVASGPPSCSAFPKTRSTSTAHSRQHAWRQ